MIPDKTEKTETPHVSVVITNYRDTENVAECLRTVLRSNYPDFEVIIVDYGTNHLESVLPVGMPNLKVIHLSRDMGIASRRNVAINESSGEFIAFLDNDTLPQPDWLTTAVPVLLRDRRVGAVQSLLLNFSNPNLVDGAGCFIDISGYPIERGRLFDVRWEQRESFRKIEPIFGAAAASLVVRREALDRVGGFDEDFVIDLEDLDLSWRLRLAGYEILLVPDSKVLHKRRSRERRISRQDSFRAFHILKNQLLCFIKNASSRSLIQYLPLIFASYFVRFFMPRKMVSVLAIKAAVWNMAALPRTLRKRCLIQDHLRKVSDQDLKPFILPFPAILVDILLGTGSLMRLMDSIQEQMRWGRSI